MAIKKKPMKLRNRTKMRKAAKQSKKRIKEGKVQKALAEADEKLAKLRKQERTAPHRIGQVYTAVKKKVGSGHWLMWLKVKQFMSKSTANYYMAIYRTFRNSKEAGLFSVEQQKLLTHKKVTDEMRETLIAHAKEGKQWTNEAFKIELTKMGGPSGKSDKTPKEVNPKQEEGAPKSEHKRWVEYVEGLLSAFEDALEDDQWKGQRKKKHIRKRYVRIGKRLEEIRAHFKVPAAGGLSSGSTVYMRKKAMKGKKNAQK